MTVLSGGTIVIFDAPSVVPFALVRQALTEAGFEPKYAKDMAKRNAFARAARELRNQRIIRKVDENETEIQFQFTKEWLAESEFCYEKECEMWLNKETGVVRSDCAELGAEAQRLVDEHQAKRNTSDITRMVMRIFNDRRGDFISLRKKGGVYFVPDTHSSLVDAVDVLMTRLKGTLDLFTIDAKKDNKTSRSVAKGLNNHLKSLIEEFKTSCKSITPDTSDAVLERRVNAISEMRDKLRSYQALLSGHADSIAEEIDKAESELVAVITAAA